MCQFVLCHFISVGDTSVTSCCLALKYYGNHTWHNAWRKKPSGKVSSWGRYSFTTDTCLFAHMPLECVNGVFAQISNNLTQLTSACDVKRTEMRPRRKQIKAGQLHNNKQMVRMTELQCKSGGTGSSTRRSNLPQKVEIQSIPLRGRAARRFLSAPFPQWDAYKTFTVVACSDAPAPSLIKFGTAPPDSGLWLLLLMFGADDLPPAYCNGKRHERYYRTQGRLI